MLNLVKGWFEVFHAVYFYPEVGIGCFLVYFVLRQTWPEKAHWIIWAPLPLSFSGSLAFFAWPVDGQTWSLVFFWSLVQWALGIAGYSLADKYGWMDAIGNKVKDKIKGTPPATPIILLAIALSLSACAGNNRPTLIEKTYSDGRVAVEIPSTPTFDSMQLPPGVDRKDVSSVVTFDLPDMPEQVNSTDPDQKAENAVNGKIGPSKSKGVSSAKKRLFVLKNGNVVADKGISKSIAGAETVKPSYSWLWWSLLAVLVLLLVTWSLDKWVGWFGWIKKLMP